MNKFESFPSQEDWQELGDEMESDTRNPRGVAQPELKDFGPPIEPDWDSLLDN